jgi:hypothetical protein
MSPDVYREVSSRGWFSRIGNSIIGGFVGLALFLIAIPVVYWNEGRAVQTYNSLKEGASVVMEVQADAADPANEGKLVHTTGETAASGPVEDPALGLSTDALVLQRNVEMYQWVERTESETKKKLGGGEETVTTYRYEKTWTDDVVDSSQFKHPEGHGNPGYWPYESEEFSAEGIYLGAFTLDESLVSQLSGWESLRVSIPDLSPNVQTSFKEQDGGLYRGADPANPQVGDFRVRFAVIEPGDVSVIARQSGTSLVGYQTKAGDSIALLEEGVVTAQEMFKSAQSANKVLTWIIRIATLFIMVIGLALVLKPLSVVADVVPLFGNIVQFGTGVLSFVVATVVWLVVVIVSWIAVRPVLGIALALAAVGLVVWLKRRKPKAA